MISWTVSAQEESSLEISGSVDTYYKYDFSGQNNQPTWFMTDHNSVSLGMIDLAVAKTTGKASFVGELALGPRGDGARDESDAATSPGAIQNLYVSYAFTDHLSVTAGFMGTFVGYEVISPLANFNYSGSYLFSHGPFQNSGVKLDYRISDKISVMLGLFSSTWDSYSADPELGMDQLGAQLSLSPADGWDVYVNYINGSQFTQWDVTTSYQISEPLYLGLNVSQNTKYGGIDSGFFGLAGYAQYGISESFALGARFENFSEGEGDAKQTVNSFTLSGNIFAGPLTIIPEFRMDASDADVFKDKDDESTDSFSQIGIAAVYSF